jgi:SAM-dependent methyltransferase
VLFERIEHMEVSFPRVDTNLDQDTEWCEVSRNGDRRRIRFHDYGDIYLVPGLYERIFYEHLKCDSPAEVCGLLRDELRGAGVEPGDLRALDVGAGNGLVGEELRDLGIDRIVGVDILEEAAMAAERDRPGLYDDYVVCDLTRLQDECRRRLSEPRPTCMTTVAALGFADIPPRAFAEAFNLVEDGGWIAFNIKADFLEGEDESGFRQLMARMVSEGILTERARRSYVHRLAMDGRPLMYVAVVGVKRGEVPASWTT